MAFRGLVPLALVAAFLVSASFAAPLSSEVKLARLNQRSASSPVIDIASAEEFDAFVEGHRNFSLIIQFTALNRACGVCRTFAPSFDIVGKSWSKMGEENRLYFATLDYDKGSEIFSRLKFTTAPVVSHYPPTQGQLAKAEFQADPSRTEKYDVSRLGLDADDFGRWVEQIVGHEIPLSKPLDYEKLLTRAFFLMLVMVLFRYVKHLKVLTSHYLPFALIAIVFTCFMISGTMWNSIRGAAMSGQKEIISPQFQQQYIIETNIVTFLYGAGAMTFVLLMLHLPNIQRPTAQRIATYAYSAIFFLLCSGVLALFRYKYTGYPFRLLL